MSIDTQEEEMTKEERRLLTETARAVAGLYGIALATPLPPGANADTMKIIVDELLAALHVAEQHWVMEEIVARHAEALKGTP